MQSEVRYSSLILGVPHNINFSSHYAFGAFASFPTPLMGLNPAFRRNMMQRPLGWHAKELTP